MSHFANRVFVSVSNDLFSDMRVDKICNTLVSMGFEVTLVGRKLSDSLELSPRNYQTKRIKLIFKKGALFYAELNLRLFFYLLFKKQGVLLSNDLDTLLANYWVSKLRGSELVYDSHEYFTEVPELKEGSFSKNTWLKIERFIFPKLKSVYTVCDSIADTYKEKYGVDVKVVRNIPRRKEKVDYVSRAELGLPSDKHILLLQGAGINLDRGAEEMVEAMKYLPINYLFVIVGGGDVFEKLKEIIATNQLESKVLIKGKIPYQELVQYTHAADLGLSLDKNTNLNYEYSLPNKLFDYIHHETPVLASNLTEIRKIIEEHEVGWILKNHNPETIANQIQEIFEDMSNFEKKKRNTSAAAEKLTWENEELVLKQIYASLVK
ncbi:MAG: glycosyltransferase [Flavobacteriales bacterium]